MKIELLINSDASLIEAIETLSREYKNHRYISIKADVGKTRTNQQNRSLHLFCKQVADELNAAGLDMEKTLKHGTAVPWTMELVKALIWSVVQEAITGEAATSKQKRDAYGQVYEIVNRHLGSTFGVHVAWPSLK